MLEQFIGLSPRNLVILSAEKWNSSGLLDRSVICSVCARFAVSKDTSAAPLQKKKKNGLVYFISGRESGRGYLVVEKWSF